MIKIYRYIIAAGLLFWGTLAGAAMDRPGAVTDMQNAMAELSGLLEAQGVVFQPGTLASNVIVAAVRAIDADASIVTPEQAERIQDEERGLFYGVGLKLLQKGKHLKIIGITTNGPAQAAGVPTGVMLEKIDGDSTENMTLEQAVPLLRGQKNATATLTVRAENKGATSQVYKVKRTVIQIPVAGTQELWPQKIGYLKINGLFEGSGEQIIAQLKLWSTTNCSGIILDLRDANGTNLAAVAAIAGLFAQPPPTLFILKDGFNKILKTYTAVKTATPLKKPVMVLVNGDTRGAAETLAAVLQNCSGVMLVGLATRGDDRFRTPLALAGGKVLYIAVRWVDLGKDSFNGKGVQPDVVVSPTAEINTVKDAVEKDFGLFSGLTEQEKQDRALNKRIGNDFILRRATDVLLGLKALNIFKN